MFFSKYIIGILVIIVSLMGASGYLYYTYATNKILILTQKNQALEEVNKSNQIAITKLQKNMQDYQELNVELQTRARSAETYVDELRKKFSKRNLTKYSKEKYIEAEKRINNATQTLFREIENETKSSTPNTN